jgi:hypothetical protein
MDTIRASFSLLLLLAAACASTDAASPSPDSPSPSSMQDTRAAAHADAAHTSYDKPGFSTDVVEGRLWIFRAGSGELAEYQSMGEPAKHVIKPGAGPNGMTVKAPDVETIQAYMAAARGFSTFVVEGRVWVFADGDAGIAEFQAQGEPAKCVTRPGAGPLGMTVKAPDSATIEAYLKAIGS